MRINILILLLVGYSLFSCQSSDPATEAKADMILQNGTIYTVNEKQPQVEAVAVKEGKIIFAGTQSDASVYAGNETEVIDLEGNTMVPGLIESHGHLMGLGYASLKLNLNGLKNYEELVEMVKAAVEKAEPGEWILGRGWHQSKWDPQPTLVKGFQTHEALSAVSPDNPVFLTHASGHAAFANAKAMEVAGINADSDVGEGGEVIRYPDGRPTGVFNETAQGLIEQHIPESTPETDRKALAAAVKACLEHGLTSFQDAGSGQAAIDLYNEFVEKDELHIRLWAMLSGGDSSLLDNWYEQGPTVSDDLTIRAIKLYADGALGSRGAWLLEEYIDRKGHTGNPIMPMPYVYKVAQDGLENGFQVCVHAIGDRANREVLDQFEKAFQEKPEAAKDSRFRIEHAQHLHPDDIPRFAQLGVIASMQAIHMASDRPWAIFRLGKLRIKQGAYVWQKLFKSGAKIINGTDAPVEPVDPIACYYAAVTRQTLAGTPDGGYEPDQKMTRMQALKTYTLDAAYGAFQENEKGSIETGKFADFTVLSQDLLTVPDDKILDTEIKMTIVGGKVKYKQ